METTHPARESVAAQRRCALLGEAGLLQRLGVVDVVVTEDEQPLAGTVAYVRLRWSRWFGPLKGFVKVYSGSEITPSSSVSSLVIDDDEALWSCGNLAVPTQAWAATIAREISNGRWAPASPTSGVGATLSGRPRDGQIHSVRWDMLSGPALS